MHIETDRNAQGTRAFYIAATAMAAAIGGFLFGYDCSILGAAILYLRDQFHLNAQMIGFAMGRSMIGWFLGPAFGGWFCDRLGREKTMILGALILGMGAFMTAVAGSITLFTIFRIVCGFAVGLAAMASPLYIAEVAPPRMRGQLGLAYQLAIVIG